MRYLAAIVFILLVCVGCTMFWYWDKIGALWLPFLVVFIERALWRAAYRLFRFLIIVELMPKHARHAYEQFVVETRSAVLAYAGHGEALWRVFPWWVRVPLIFVGAGIAGGFAFILLVLPVHVGKIPFVGGWLRETGVPYLMRVAAARGIELNLPGAWMGMSARIRERVKRPYMRLWWWTARKLVRSRQAFGRRAAKLHNKRKLKI